MPQLSALRLTHQSTTSTELTCNCLLPRVASTSLAAAESADHRFYAAFYQLGSADADDGPAHSGDLAVFTAPEGFNTAATVTARASSSSSTTAAASGTDRNFPGVFDVMHLPPGTRVSTSSSTETGVDDTPLLLAACTDGSARLFPAGTLRTTHVFASLHEEMLTSATPLLMRGADHSLQLRQLLCTAHTGAVLLYDVAQAQVTQTLEGHEFDAWCSAVRTEDESTLGGSGGARLLMSGGDDGLLKFYDARAENTAVAKMRFDAGVVSISPVVNSPYVLVGSYAETLSLIDERYRKRPVATCAGLGGGVWRTNRLLPSWVLASETSTAHAPVDRPDRASMPPGCVPESGALLIPLMQRGAAIVGFDVAEAGEAVFSAPLNLHALPEGDADQDAASAWAQGSTCGAVTDNVLVYDTAVLDTAAESRSRVKVATCSFYEKRVDVWSLERVVEA